jgi:TRIAD3 protein (E3 ubiquitin-protein ligase RNF216)
MGQKLSKVPEIIRGNRGPGCSHLRQLKKHRDRRKQTPNADQNIGAIQVRAEPASPQSLNSSTATMEESGGGISDSEKDMCKNDVLFLFEDICPKHLRDLARKHTFQSEAIVAEILDQQERGIQYPKRDNTRKRKRDDEENMEKEGGIAINAKIDDPQYIRRMRMPKYKDMATLLISQDFPLVPKNTIKNKLNENGLSVFRTYTTLDDTTRNWDNNNPAWMNKKTATKVLDQYTPDNITNLDVGTLDAEQRSALDEFLAARVVRNGKDVIKAAEIEEEQNITRAKMHGEMADCGCCFEEFPLNRMVHCEGQEVHWFCRGCMTQQAETTIGYSKYDLSCLSMDGCSAGFSMAQRRMFLDEKLQTALDRIEQQAVLREAGIENLETCPFCPFAMEYPPVEENKEFRCTNADCEITSCRLCRKKTHIPKTCAEAAAEEGHSARHTIEEAMSEAVIRKCNKCKLSILEFWWDARIERRKRIESVCSSGLTGAYRCKPVHQTRRVQQDHLHTMQHYTVLRLPPDSQGLRPLQRCQPWR